jgi:hypothetical protein
MASPWETSPRTGTPGATPRRSGGRQEGGESTTTGQSSTTSLGDLFANTLAPFVYRFAPVSGSGSAKTY